MFAERYSIINLRRSLPIGSLISYLQDLKVQPEWIFISISQVTYVRTLRRQIEAIQSLGSMQYVKIAVGGAGTKGVTHFPGVDYIMGDQHDFRSFVQKLLE